VTALPPNWGFPPSLSSTSRPTISHHLLRSSGLRARPPRAMSLFTVSFGLAGLLESLARQAKKAAIRSQPIKAITDTAVAQP
jgi:hypothetical protein